jgi:hypothetical protein
MRTGSSLILRATTSPDNPAKKKGKKTQASGNKIPKSRKSREKFSAHSGNLTTHVNSTGLAILEKPPQAPKRKTTKAPPKISWSKKLANAAANAANVKDAAEEHARQAQELKRNEQLAERKAFATDVKRRNYGIAPFMPSLSEEYDEAIPSEQSPLGSLAALTKILDKRLYEGGTRARNIHPTLDGLFQSAK